MSNDTTEEQRKQAGEPQENTGATPQPKANRTAAEPAKDGTDGHTKVEQNGETAPRMPHERDQSSERQINPGGGRCGSRASARQALQRQAQAKNSRPFVNAAAICRSCIGLFLSTGLPSSQK